MAAFNEADEPETVEYRVFICQDEKLLSFIDTYSDSDAILFHDDRFAKNFADEVSGLSLGTRLCIYGIVSDQHKNFAKENSFEVEYFDTIDGFSR